MHSKSRALRSLPSFFAVLLFPCLASAAPKFQEGQWEYRVSIEMPGMQAKMQPMTYSRCVTQKDLVPKMPQMNCEPVSHKVSGDTVTWTAKCKEKDTTMESNGRVTYKADTMEGTIKNTMTVPGQPTPFSTSMNVSGRRTGACKK